MWPGSHGVHEWQYHKEGDGSRGRLGRSMGKHWGEWLKLDPKKGLDWHHLEGTLGRAMELHGGTLGGLHGGAFGGL